MMPDCVSQVSDLILVPVAKVSRDATPLLPCLINNYVKNVLVIQYGYVDD